MNLACPSRRATVQDPGLAKDRSLDSAFLRQREDLGLPARLRRSAGFKLGNFYAQPVDRDVALSAERANDAVGISTDVSPTIPRSSWHFAGRPTTSPQRAVDDDLSS